MAIPFRVTWRSLFLRRTANGLTAAGLGLLVMALVVVWGLADGLRSMLRTGGDPANLLVLRAGSSSEIVSGIDTDTSAQVAASEGIDRDAQGKPLVSAELMVLINQPRRGARPDSSGRYATADSTNITVRGIGEQGLALRPDLRIVSGGRTFTPGLHELLVSRRMAARFAGCGIGETLVVKKTPFRVVGLFEAPGSPYESDLLTDESDLATTQGRMGYVSSVLLRASDPAARQGLAARLQGDRRFNLKVQDQRAFFADQAGSAFALVALAVTMTLFLSVGACFAAANTSYASVLARSREIGTLRALGFSRRAILAATLAESLLLSLAAGVIGLVLGGIVMALVGSAGTMGSNFAEVTFQLHVTPFVAVVALATSAAIGVVGGFPPALRAALLPIVDALRAA